METIADHNIGGDLVLLLVSDHAQSRSMNDISDTPNTDQVMFNYPIHSANVCFTVCHSDHNIYISQLVSMCTYTCVREIVNERKL